MTHEELKQLENLMVKFEDRYACFMKEDNYNNVCDTLEFISDVRMIDVYPKEESR